MALNYLSAWAIAVGSMALRAKEKESILLLLSFHHIEKYFIDLLAHITGFIFSQFENVVVYFFIEVYRGFYLRHN